MSQQIFIKNSFFSFPSSSSFYTLCKNHYDLCVQASILLKFGTRIGGIKKNTYINFGAYLFNIRGVKSDFTHKTKSNFCQANRVNRFEEQTGNWYVAGLNIRGVPFGS